MADRVESVIREKIVYIAGTTGGGHWRRDLTDEPVKFFPVYSYLIVYRPGTKPLQIIAILHGRRDLERLLKHRLSGGTSFLVVHFCILISNKRSGH